MNRKARKFLNLFSTYLYSRLRTATPFVRIIPTDNCNLKCEYCWQRSNDPYQMSLDDFSGILAHAKRLHVGLMTFLGGEPLIWRHVYDAIRLCTENNVVSDLTTNGTLLNAKTVNRLGRSGLDYLNISVDGTAASTVSKKTSVMQNNLVEVLKQARTEYGMHFRINLVIFKNNFDDLQRVVEFAHDQDVQISLGYIVPPLDKTLRQTMDICFTEQDRPLIKRIVSYVLDKKAQGYPIIDPDEYFTNIFKFLNHDKFWNCNYPTRYGWINVTPHGRIRSCTKKMDELDARFVDLNPTKIRELRRTFAAMTRECNTECYSNCAYDSFFYTHHKRKMIHKILSRIFRAGAHSRSLSGAVERV